MEMLKHTHSLTHTKLLRAVLVNICSPDGWQLNFYHQPSLKFWFLGSSESGVFTRLCATNLVSLTLNCISVAEVGGGVLYPLPNCISVAEVEGIVLYPLPNCISVAEVGGYYIHCLTRKFVWFCYYTQQKCPKCILGRHGAIEICFIIIIIIIITIITTCSGEKCSALHLGRCGFSLEQS